MDINNLRSAVTLVSFFLFLGIVFWAYRKRNASRFEQDAQLVFLGEAPEAGATSQPIAAKEG